MGILKKNVNLGIKFGKYKKSYYKNFRLSQITKFYLDLQEKKGSFKKIQLMILEWKKIEKFAKYKIFSICVQFFVSIFLSSLF